MLLQEGSSRSNHPFLSILHDFCWVGSLIALVLSHVNDTVIAYLVPLLIFSTKCVFSEPEVKNDSLPVRRIDNKLSPQLVPRQKTDPQCRPLVVAFIHRSCQTTETCTCVCAAHNSQPIKGPHWPLSEGAVLDFSHHMQGVYCQMLSKVSCNKQTITIHYYWSLKLYMV